MIVDHMKNIYAKGFNNSVKFDLNYQRQHSDLKVKALAIYPAHSTNIEPRHIDSTTEFLHHSLVS